MARIIQGSINYSTERVLTCAKFLMEAIQTDRLTDGEIAGATQATDSMIDGFRDDVRAAIKETRSVGEDDRKYVTSRAMQICVSVLLEHMSDLLDIRLQACAPNRKSGLMNSEALLIYRDYAGALSKLTKTPLYAFRAVSPNSLFNNHELTLAAGVIAEENRLKRVRAGKGFAASRAAAKPSRTVKQSVVGYAAPTLTVVS